MTKLDSSLGDFGFKGTELINMLSGQSALNCVPCL